jgi:hypothetical protein
MTVAELVNKMGGIYLDNILIYEYDKNGFIKDMPKKPTSYSSYPKVAKMEVERFNITFNNQNQLRCEIFTKIPV